MRDCSEPPCRNRVRCEYHTGYHDGTRDALRSTVDKMLRRFRVRPR